MTRFWMTLESAADSVVRVIALMQGGEVFVPKAPSVNIVDLAKAVAPDCEIRYTGIRAGEKIHECLISQHEARHTRVLEDMFVILAESNWRQSNRHFDSWKHVQEQFTYTSDNNDQWLSVDELRKMLDQMSDVVPTVDHV